MERRWKVASIGGIPIYITIPWLIFAAFVVYGTYESLARTRASTEQQALGWSVVNAVLFYGSIILHELAHAATARAFGLPVHGITLVFWGGYTETHSSERGPLASFLISAAGPVQHPGPGGCVLDRLASSDGVLSAILGNLAFLSLLFAGLNALPGFPRRRRPHAAGRRLGDHEGPVPRPAGGRVGRRGRRRRPRARSAIQRLRAQDGDWLFFAFIGWMMISQGLQVGKQSPILRDLSRGQVSEAMGPPPPPIPADATLLHALETHLRADRTTEFPVVEGFGRVIGSLSFSTAAKVGGSDPTRGVRSAMTPRERMRVVRPDLPLDRALEWIAGGGQALVLDGERLARSAHDERRRPVVPAPDLGRDRRRRDAAPVPPRPDLGGVGDWR